MRMEIDADVPIEVSKAPGKVESLLASESTLEEIHPRSVEAHLDTTYVFSPVSTC